MSILLKKRTGPGEDGYHPASHDGNHMATTTKPYQPPHHRQQIKALVQNMLKLLPPEGFEPPTNRL